MKITKKIMEEKGTERLKRGFAKMQKGGVIMDVINAEQARIAEKAGAVAVMALEKVPSDIRAAGGVARMADPKKIKEIMKAVTIPVIAKCRIGHFAEAQILEALGVDMIDESEVLTPVSEEHIDKRKFVTPFVCGARNLGEALRRINEGAAMIRTKGEPGTGNVVEAVRHMKIIQREILALKKMSERELKEKAREYGVPEELVKEVKKLGRLPVVNFAAGGIATPADAALMMQMGADGIFVGSGIFKSSNPEKYAKAIVQATLHYDNPKLIAEISSGLGEAMPGLDIKKLAEEELMQIKST
jgi:pyridoxal 5'-phosphate synthase pdxS subunit